MKILVTGSGFISQHLINKLTKLPENHEIAYTTHRNLNYHDSYFDQSNLFGERYHCDLTIEDDVKKILEKFQPDLIYHLAGRATVKDDEFALMKANAHSTHLLLNHCKFNTIFVLASSLVVHGDCSNKIGDADIPNKPTSIYGISKLTAEKFVLKYHNDGKIKGRILRLVATCGPNQSHGVFKDVVAKLKSDSEFLELLGSCPGSQKGYLHIDDVVQAFMISGLNYHQDKLLIANVAQEDEITIEELANIVIETIKIKKEIKWLGASANWSNDNLYLGGHSDVLPYFGWKKKFATSKEVIKQACLNIGV